MYAKLDVTRSEMLRLREQGLSNQDIANSLDISVPTVYRYIGSQGKRMGRLAAFVNPKEPTPEPTTEETPKSSPRAVDKLELTYEIVKSAEGNFSAELDYETLSVSVLNSSIKFDKLPELVTFVVGLAARVTGR